MHWEPINRKYIEYMPVSHIIWSPNGEQVAVCGSSGGLWLCTDQLKYIRRMEGYIEFAQDANWSPDGTKLVSNGKSFFDPLLSKKDSFDAIRIWDTQTGAVLQTLYESFDYYSVSVAYSPDGQMIASPINPNHTDLPRNDTIRLWNATSGIEFAEYRSYIKYVNGIKWNNKCDRIMVIGDDECEILNIETGQVVFHLDSEYAKWSPDGNSVFRITSAHHPEIIDVQSNPKVHILDTRNKRFQLSKNTFGWNNDGSQVAAISEQGEVYIWNVADGSVQNILSSRHTGFTLLLWRPNHGHMICLENGEATLWDILGNTPLFSLRSCPVQISDVLWDSTGTRLAAVGYEGCSQTWIFQDDQATPSVPIPVNLSDMTKVDSIKWSPNNQHIAISIKDRPLQIWDIAFSAKKQAHQIYRDLGHTQCVAWSHNGIFVAETNENLVHIWDAESLERVFNLKINDNINHLFWSNDDTEIIVSAYSTSTSTTWISRWNIYTSQLQTVPLQDWLQQITDISDFDSSDLGGYRQISRFIRSYHQHVLDLLQTQQDISPRPVSLVNDQLALTYKNGMVKVLNVEDGREICTFHDHFRRVRALSWHPHGNLLLTAGNDRTVRIYDISTQQLLQTLHHNSLVIDATWSPDGTKIATVSLDNLLQIWDSY